MLNIVGGGRCTHTHSHTLTTHAHTHTHTHTHTLTRTYFYRMCSPGWEKSCNPNISNMFKTKRILTQPSFAERYVRKPGQGQCTPHADPSIHSPCTCTKGETSFVCIPGMWPMPGGQEVLHRASFIKDSTCQMPEINGLQSWLGAQLYWNSLAFG